MSAGGTVAGARKAQGAARKAEGAARKQTTGRKATKVVESAGESAAKLRAEAKADAARIRAQAEAEARRVRQDAEEHARHLILDARATADGVRAEGMELVSNLRLIGDSLRLHAEHLQRDIESIHARMVGELGQAGLAQDEASAPSSEPLESPVAPSEELDVPDFIQQK